MGCVENRSISAQEKAIIIAEKGLGFHLLDSNQIDFTIRKYSSQNIVNQNQFQRICSQLQIPLKNYQIHSKISQFYISLKNSKKKFLFLKDFLILGILLSTGSPKNKAELLFQAFDQHSNRSLPLQFVKEEILKSIVRISILLSLLVANGQSQFANQLKIKKYIEDIELVQNDAVNRVSEKMIRPRASMISETEFVDGLAGVLGGTLTTASGWRQYLNEIYVANPPQKAFLNPFAKRNLTKADQSI